MEVVVVVVRGEGKSRTREESFGESELKTTLQCSATFAAESKEGFFWGFFSVPQILTIKSL